MGGGNKGGVTGECQLREWKHGVGQEGPGERLQRALCLFLGIMFLSVLYKSFMIRL